MSVLESRTERAELETRLSAVDFSVRGGGFECRNVARNNPLHDNTYIGRGTPPELACLQILGRS